MITVQFLNGQGETMYWRGGHLGAVDGGLVVGSVVFAGDQVGTVGASGNAARAGLEARLCR